MSPGYATGPSRRGGPVDAAYADGAWERPCGRCGAAAESYCQAGGRDVHAYPVLHPPEGVGGAGRRERGSTGQPEARNTQQKQRGGSMSDQQERIRDLERELRHATAIAACSIGQPDRAENVAYREQVRAKLDEARASSRTAAKDNQA